MVWKRAGYLTVPARRSALLYHCYHSMPAKLSLPARITPLCYLLVKTSQFGRISRSAGKRLTDYGVISIFLMLILYWSCFTQACALESYCICRSLTSISESVSSGLQKAKPLPEFESSLSIPGSSLWSLPEWFIRGPHWLVILTGIHIPTAAIALSGSG